MNSPALPFAQRCKFSNQFRASLDLGLPFETWPAQSLAHTRSWFHEASPCEAWTKPTTSFCKTAATSCFFIMMAVTDPSRLHFQSAYKAVSTRPPGICLATLSATFCSVAVELKLFPSSPPLLD